MILEKEMSIWKNRNTVMSVFVPLVLTLLFNNMNQTVQGRNCCHWPYRVNKCKIKIRSMIKKKQPFNGLQEIPSHARFQAKLHFLHLG